MSDDFDVLVDQATDTFVSLVSNGQGDIAKAGLRETLEAIRATYGNLGDFYADIFLTKIKTELMIRIAIDIASDKGSAE